MTRWEAECRLFRPRVSQPLNPLGNSWHQLVRPEADVRPNVTTRQLSPLGSANEWFPGVVHFSSSPDKIPERPRHPEVHTNESPASRHNSIFYFQTSLLNTLYRQYALYPQQKTSLNSSACTSEGPMTCGESINLERCPLYDIAWAEKLLHHKRQLHEWRGTRKTSMTQVR